MKTPREVLFQRHSSAEPGLDAIRERVVASVGDEAAREVQKAQRNSPLQNLRKFILPLRWHFAGMSAAWILIAVLNIDRPSISPAPQQATASPRQLLAELR